METGKSTAAQTMSGGSQGRGFTVRNWVWPVVYLLTILAFLTWYEILPRLWAYSYLQGDWQASVGSGAKEKPSPYFVRFRNGEARSCHQIHGQWTGGKGRVRLTPAANFYVVDRYLDYGRSRGNHMQYLVHLRDGKFYELRGLTPLDPIQSFQATLLRRTDELPTAAKEMLDSQ